MLHIDSLTFRIGGRTLLEGASLHIAAGQRVGLVGRNGAGKTTLFRLIEGALQPDDGAVRLRPGARLGVVAQEIPDSTVALLDFTLSHDLERAALLAEAETTDDGPRQAWLQERLSAIGAHSAPARAASILAGLGFDEAAQARPLNSFSGGWRMRAALAGALFAEPDLLLLDEPTNHLDLEATLWLQGHLAVYPGTLLIISHDRELLNAVPGRIAHIEAAKIIAYGGNYDRFVQVRREKLELAGKMAARQADQRARLQAFIDRFRAKATKAKQAQSRVKMLEKLGPPIAVIEDQGMSFDFPDPESLSPPILAIDKGRAGYAPDKPVLSGLSLRIDMDDRIALLGANGNGKSTLAKILAGRLALLDGTMARSPRLRVGYFAQHQTDELNLSATPYDHMAAVLKDAPPAKIRAHLGRFGFTQDRALVTVSQLSGGEKSRLLFALMSRDSPHLMILDEPTNHLDIDARDALIEALNAYQGAVILISHDSHLVELVADRLWLVEGGKAAPFDGDLAQYRQHLLDSARAARREEQGDRGSASRRDERRAAAQKRGQLAPLKKAAEKAESEVARLGGKVRQCEEKLADPALYAGDGAKAAVVARDLGEVKKALAEAEEVWFAAQEAYEEAAAED
ncbi:MAG: ABC-F family ATP-binding cassette domain-containing protein [Rhodospirillaceae bacterium]|nr:ABC-F family ATP-binding cassette domain-containing protein [Rhodospirillaceae bacterium]